MEILELITSNLMIMLTIIGIMAFVVSLITEVTKDIGFLKYIPTDVQVIVLSVVLCQVAYFGYIAAFAIQFKWYISFACVIGAFIVAFVSMYGWEKLTTLYNRFKK